MIFVCGSLCFTKTSTSKALASAHQDLCSLRPEFVPRQQSTFLELCIGGASLWRKMQWRKQAPAQETHIYCHSKPYQHNLPWSRRGPKIRLAKRPSHQYFLPSHGQTRSGHERTAGSGHERAIPYLYPYLAIPQSSCRLYL